MRKAEYVQSRPTLVQVRSIFHVLSVLVLDGGRPTFGHIIVIIVIVVIIVAVCADIILK